MPDAQARPGEQQGHPPAVRQGDGQPCGHERTLAGVKGQGSNRAAKSMAAEPGV